MLAALGMPRPRVDQLVEQVTWYADHGDGARAEELCHEVLRLDPQDPRALARLGALFAGRGLYDHALSVLDRVAARVPGHVSLTVARARVATFVDPAAAERYAREALALDPRHAEAWCVLGLAAHARDDVDGALAGFRRAIELDPRHSWAHMATGACTHHLGDHCGGFLEFSRVLRPEGPVRWAPGDRLDGRRILIADAHGIGDSALFCRYVPVLAARGARITIATTWVPQVRLLGCLPGVERAFVSWKPAALLEDPAWGDALITDFWALPWLLEVTSPADDRRLVTHPYLTPDPADRALWRARLADDGRLRVGLAWGSSEPWPPCPRHRSVPLSALAPLGRVPGVRFYSFQFGRPAAALDDPPFEITNLAPSIRDTTETVAAVSLMDLVIAPDCGVANLAAAAGVRTWVLLRAGCLADWRWGSGDTSPWYPSSRRFQQQVLGDWREPVERVADELAKLAARRRAA